MANKMAQIIPKQMIHNHFNSLICRFSMIDEIALCIIKIALAAA